ncbi:hypothetical protein AB6A40_003520 [Gnathostoma spinigerum]|uniref:ZP domain-containing protein n=1 Tax=Gnathostoma spinigerum TaxID=75299 RepID=A0ABD6EHE7_9BILA
MSFIHPSIIFAAVIQLVDQLTLVEAISIDNGLTELPHVICTDRSMTLRITTNHPFRGTIFAKNHYALPLCRREYYGNIFKGAVFSIPLDECGMRRIRQLQPMGFTYSIIIVISFHSQFITKIDRAFNVRCFYSQLQKEVKSELEIGMLQTEDLNEASIVLPTCEYSLRYGSVDGPSVQMAKIGEPLVHRWKCDNRM